MTHFCSLRLTHTKNTICRKARNWASNIIHAEGVRVVLPSSAPKARNALMSQQGTAGRGEMIDRRKAAGPRREAFARGQESGLPANRAPPTRGGGGSLFASNVGSFLASAEGHTGSYQGRDGI